MSRQSFWVDGSDEGVKLECISSRPLKQSDGIKTLMILAHPYPPLGGDMRNNVVGTLFMELGHEFHDRLLIVSYNSRFDSQLSI
jgi:alpha/beta superfamily hydrolase